MEVRYICTDCGLDHEDPGEATLGLHVRCLACQIEVDLAIELAAAQDAELHVTRTLAA